MAKFAGLTDDERTELELLHQAVRDAATTMSDARLAFDVFLDQLRTKYDLDDSDQITTQTEQELQNARAEHLMQAHAAIADAIVNASPGERAKHDAWVAAGRPVTEKTFPGAEE